ncbi:transglycosylase domain-containing protein [Streptomyces fractus]|uniref:transglycosylase domain-containing protein n=1 Tax=Streptomyces fractus TaxID=641806 RepID=UPI003CF770CA
MSSRTRQAGGRGAGAGGRPRRARKPGARKRRGWRRIFPTWRMVLGAFLGIVTSGAVVFALGFVLVGVPDPNAEATAQASVFEYADGSKLTKTGETNRESVPLSEISEAAQQAALAAEDQSFYSEGAINLKGITRAAVDTLGGKGIQGGSTITQQYVKNYYLTQQQTLSRKFKEMFISVKLDIAESKDQILDGYLNTAYYGRGAYGIQAAAQAYYGIDAAQLDVAQSAYLAALLNAPGVYDVSTDTPDQRQAAIDRWDYVLDGMVDMGNLSQSERAGMTFPEPLPPQASDGMSGQSGYLVTAAERSLVDSGTLTQAQLDQGGYTIELTVDPISEKELEASVENSGAGAEEMQTGAVSVDPQTGEVVALYGGADYDTHYVDNATRQDYQVGSTFKPIVLAAALEEGATTQDGRKITPDTVYGGDSGTPVKGGTGTAYAPPNEDDKDYGDVTVQQAMDWSVNAVYAQMAQDAGLQNVVDMAQKLGLPSDTPGLDAQPSVALGVSTPSLMDMAGVYATFANEGQQITPWIVKSVSHDGQKVELPDHTAKQAISKETADTVNSVLQGVVSGEGGTGSEAQKLGRPVAGKTGTSDDDKSALFIAHTPQLVTAVGAFGEDPSTGAQVSLDGLGGNDRVNGGGYPAQIWTAYTAAALNGTPVRQFDSGPTQSAYWPDGQTTAASGTGSTQPSPTPSPSTPVSSGGSGGSGGDGDPVGGSPSKSGDSSGQETPRKDSGTKNSGQKAESDGKGTPTTGRDGASPLPSEAGTASPGEGEQSPAA